jgi:AraC-like DNA-binding protein
MELIANSRLSAKEIAFHCGFTHAAHLSTAFRRAFGLTPRDAIHRYRHPSA